TYFCARGGYDYPLF
nr:immunoglobulin heavy chain junction region [Mus musculus]